MINERLETVHTMLGQDKKYRELMDQTAEILSEAKLPKELHDKLQLVLNEREWHVSWFCYREGARDGVKLMVTKEGDK